MRSTTATATIQELHRLFAYYRLPVQLVQDNGPQFTSKEFQEFTKGKGIKHIRCAPYHPSCNGASEWFVQTLKRAMKVTEKSSLPFQLCLTNFLLMYRSTPHCWTCVALCTLFLGATGAYLAGSPKPKHWGGSGSEPSRSEVRPWQEIQS